MEDSFELSMEGIDTINQRLVFTFTESISFIRVKYMMDFGLKPFIATGELEYVFYPEGIGMGITKRILVDELEVDKFYKNNDDDNDKLNPNKELFGYVFTDEDCT